MIFFFCSVAINTHRASWKLLNKDTNINIIITYATKEYTSSSEIYIYIYIYIDR